MRSSLFAVVVALGMLMSAQAQAALQVRYIRLEGPTSGRMAVTEVEAYSRGQNILQGNKDVGITGWAMRGLRLPDEKARERTVIDGKDGGRGFTFGASPDSPGGVNPWVEFDLGREYPIEQIVIKQPIEPAYTDRFLRLVTLMDGQRKVVLAQTYDNRSKEVNKGTIAIKADPAKSVRALMGRQVPAGADFWAPVSQLVPMVESPPPADVNQRLAAFQARNSPQAIQKLAEQFMAELDLDSPKLAQVKAKWEAGDAQGALDAYRDYFFAKLESAVYMRENRMALNYAPGADYPGQADDLLNGVIVGLTNRDASARRYQPGAFDWAFVPEKAPETERVAVLQTIRKWALVNTFGVSLLHEYVITGDQKYMDGWAATMDDWAMHFMKDVEGSPYNLRSYFPKDPLQHFYYMCYRINELRQERPELARAMPSATLARMLLAVLEEYPAQYWRSARVLSFNHMFNAFNGAYPSSQILNDFHAGNRFEREVRQDWERIWTWKITRDGSMIEAGDEGHMAVPLVLARAYHDMLAQPPEWLTPLNRIRAEHGIGKIYEIVLRNITPDGYDHRYADPDAFQRVWELTKTRQQFQGGGPLAVFRHDDFFKNPEVRAIYDTVYGRGSKPANSAREAAREQVIGFFEGDYQGPPKMVSDWLPYIGYHYLRGSWKPDAAFIHVTSQATDSPSTNGQYWSTGFSFHDFGYPLLYASPLLVDGQEQNPDYGRPTLNPGSKTSRISAAPHDPIQARWHTSELYDFAEAFFEGTYQSLQQDRDRDWARSPFTPGPHRPRGPAIEGVKSTRQIMQIRPYNLFVVTDRVELADASGTHEYTMNYSFLSAQTPEQKAAAEAAARAAADAGRRTGMAAEEPEAPALAAIAAPAVTSSGTVKPDAASRQIAFDNPASPSVRLYHFSTQPISFNYGDSKWRYPIHFRNHVYPGVAGFEQVGTAVKWQARGNSALVTLLSSKPAGGEERVARVQPVSNGNVTGFDAAMRDGGSISYRTTSSGAARMSAGDIQAEAEGLLLVKTADGQATGMAVGVRSISVGGKAAPVASADFEFRLNGSELVETAQMLLPIKPVRFEPNVNVFTDSVEVTMSSPTPGVEIRYTTDGTEPTADSPLYTGPITLTASTDIQARAFRPGVKEIPFTAAGTQVSAVSYASFQKQGYLEPAADVAQLTPGLKYDYLEGTWFKLYTYADRLPAVSSGRTTRLLDVSARKTDGPFGMRYTGYIQIPADGVYTFHAPDELWKVIVEPGYDLRLYIDGQEWYLGQMWHGRGQWSVPLRAGAHEFMVTFADARAKDIEKQRSDTWAGFPRPWVVWRGTAPEIQISGPGIERQPIPDAWLFYKP